MIVITVTLHVLVIIGSLNQVVQLVLTYLLVIARRDTEISPNPS